MHSGLTRRRLILLTLVVWLAVVAGFFWWVVNLMICRPEMGYPDHPRDPDGVALTAVNASGQRIAAWFYPGRPGAGALLLCHGHGVDHGNFTSLFPFLRRAGLALITLDFRAHGQSGGQYTSIGEREWEDLAAVLAAVASQGLLPASQPLAAYGRSMGAATLANGAAHLPRIDAFVLESCFAELRLIAGRDARREMHLPDNPLFDLFFALASWRTGYDYAGNRPVAAIAGVASRPLLLIHDALDPRATTEDHQRLARAVPHARTLTFANANHVQGHAVNPPLFEREFLAFLASAGIPLAP